MALSLTCIECGLVVAIEPDAARRPITCPSCRAALDRAVEAAPVEERLEEVSEAVPYRRGTAASDKDDDLPRPTRSRPRTPRPPPAPPDRLGMALAIGTALVFVLLGLSIWLPFWTYSIVVVKGDVGGWPMGFWGGTTEYLALVDTWRGRIFVALSFLAAVAMAGAYLGYGARGHGETDWLDGLGSAAGVGWALTTLVWLGGYYLWWLWVRQPANDQPMTFGGGTLKYIQTPALGCYVALALALTALAGCVTAALWRKRHTFALAGAATGLLLGGLLVVADVRPWSDRVAWVVTPTEMEQVGKMVEKQFFQGRPAPPPPPRPRR